MCSVKCESVCTSGLCFEDAYANLVKSQNVFKCT